MTINPNPYRMALLMAAAFLFVVGLALAHGEQPECLGDRHYDGVACCPVATTTTTLPDVDPRACPDPGPCPTVVCDCEGTCGSPVNVTINRCPDVKFPAYAPCRERRPGVVRDGDVMFNGKAYKCPRKGTPRRYFIPQGAESR